MARKRIKLDEIDYSEILTLSNRRVVWDEIVMKDGSRYICTLIGIKMGHLVIEQTREQFDFQMKSFGGYPIVYN